MVNSRGMTRVVVTLVAACWSTSGAFAATQPSDEARETAGARWQLLEPAPDGSVELVARDRAGAIAAVCNERECGVFIEPVAGCVPGSRYPLLINSARQVGVFASTCGVLTSNGSSRYVVRPEKQNALFPAMLRGDEVTIAFPTQEGSVNVIRVSMAGVREHLARLLPLTSSNAGAALRPLPFEESSAGAAGGHASDDGARDGQGPAPRAGSEAGGGGPPAKPRRFIVPDRKRFSAAMITA